MIMSIKRNYEATYKYGQELSCDLVAGTFFIMETKNKKSTHFLTFSWCSLFLDTFFFKWDLLCWYHFHAGFVWFTVYSNLSLSLKTNKQKKPLALHGDFLLTSFFYWLILFLLETFLHNRSLLTFSGPSGLQISPTV